jgi:hypothetical protein
MISRIRAIVVDSSTCFTLVDVPFGAVIVAVTNRSET